jgi:hypothetical protein
MHWHASICMGLCYVLLFLNSSRPFSDFHMYETGYNPLMFLMFDFESFGALCQCSFVFLVNSIILLHMYPVT